MYTIPDHKYFSSYADYLGYPGYEHIIGGSMSKSKLVKDGKRLVGKKTSPGSYEAKAKMAYLRSLRRAKGGACPGAGVIGGYYPGRQYHGWHDRLLNGSIRGGDEMEDDDDIPPPPSYSAPPPPAPPAPAPPAPKVVQPAQPAQPEPGVQISPSTMKLANDIKAVVKKQDLGKKALEMVKNGGVTKDGVKGIVDNLASGVSNVASSFVNPSNLVNLAGDYVNVVSDLFKKAKQAPPRPKLAPTQDSVEECMYWLKKYDGPTYKKVLSLL